MYYVMSNFFFVNPVFELKRFNMAKAKSWCKPDACNEKGSNVRTCSNIYTFDVLFTLPFCFWHYQKRARWRVPEALGKALKTLDKGFAECDTRQRRLDKQCIDKAFFAEYFFSGTRQRGLPSAREHSAKKSGRYGDGVMETASLSSVKDDTRQRARQGGSPCQVLCRVLCAALGKACLFAECQRHNTRRSP
jgi:hypothetical protein